MPTVSLTATFQISLMACEMSFISADNMATEQFWVIKPPHRQALAKAFSLWSTYCIAIQIHIVHLHTASSRNTYRFQWERNSPLVWLDDIFVLFGHRCLLHYAFTCAPAVKFSQGILGLIEPRRDCGMDGRWAEHWPVTLTPPCLHTLALPFLTPPCEDMLSPQSSFHSRSPAPHPHAQLVNSLPSSLIHNWLHQHDSDSRSSCTPPACISLTFVCHHLTHYTWAATSTNSYCCFFLFFLLFFLET